MKVTLPKQCLGKEIVEAFKRAAAIEVQGKWFKGDPYNWRWKWVPEEYEGEIEYEHGSVRRIVHKGVTAIHHQLRHGRKYLFFGEKYERWLPVCSEYSGPQQIRLLPLREDRMYDAVDIRNGREINDWKRFQDGWHEHLEDDDVKFRDSIEKIIAGLFKQVSP
ncbi:MAG: hypothetical protein Athens071426_107 [Parcubacteria group bacterium Athens0714_26]|nr:MAG: hypothetical protein Athens101426_344 [Parcubacteria group bacterium Athens1014_26]TSD03713.1 MAG: hypothetical protein Athens071426_107 [Parcubacteria group bacterium Athens0714_26]